MLQALSTLSLEAAPGPDAEELCLPRDLLSEADLRRRTGTVPADAFLTLERDEALRHAVRRMSPWLREVCRRLAAGNVTAVARDMGISRRQVRKAIRDIRRHFEQAGLGDS